MIDIRQLCLLRSLRKSGLPAELLDIFLNRCGASRDDWQGLWDWGLVVEEKGRFVLTQEGRKQYARNKRGRYF